MNPHRCKAILKDGERCPNQCKYDMKKKGYLNWCEQHVSNCSQMHENYKDSKCLGIEKKKCYDYDFDTISRTYIRGGMKNLSLKQLEQNINDLYECMEARKTFENNCIHPDVRDKGHEHYLKNIKQFGEDCRQVKNIVKRQQIIREDREKEYKESEKLKRLTTQQKKKEEKEEEKRIQEAEKEEKRKKEEEMWISIQKEIPVQKEKKSKRIKQKQNQEKTEDEILNEAILQNKLLELEQNKPVSAVSKSKPKSNMSVYERMLMKKEQENIQMDLIKEKAKKEIFDNYYDFLGLTEKVYSEFDQKIQNILSDFDTIIFERLEHHYKNYLRYLLNNKNINDYIEDKKFQNEQDIELQNKIQNLITSTQI
jgi:hypothetical protein